MKILDQISKPIILIISAIIILALITAMVMLNIIRPTPVKALEKTNFSVIEYDVSKEWEEKKKGDDTIYYYNYGKKGDIVDYLYVSVQKDSDASKVIEDEASLDSFIGGLKNSGNLKGDVKKADITIDGRAGKELSCKSDLHSKNTTVKTAIFSVGDSLFCFMFSSTRSANYAAFDDVVKSIKIDKSYESLEKNLKDIRGEIDNAKMELDTIKTNIDTQKTELSRLEDSVSKSKSAPKSMQAGNFVVGTDFAAGRYKIYGGSSNFIVHNSAGRLQVNIILGGDSYSVSEYTYNFKAGDKVKAESAFKLQPLT